MDGHCPVKSCTVTSNHSYLPSLRDYDALLFFHWNWKGAETFPPPQTRRPDQFYVLAFLESAAKSRERFGRNDSRGFNLTMSYR